MRAAWLGLVVAALCVVAPAARCNDRPYQVARTAVLEDDDEDTWSIESWVQRLGSVRGVSIEPEYTFGDGYSVQVELTRYLDRHDDETGHEAEIEFKRVFNDIHQDGWGWGLSAALTAERSAEAGTVSSVSVKLPVSIALGRDGGYLHLDAGVGKARGERLDWTGAVGLERELLPHTVFFAELARSRGDTYGQLGVRHWVRREKLAIDFSVQQQRLEGRRGSGFIVGVGWYDL